MSTERRNPRSVDIDLFPTERILKIINAEDALIAGVVEAAIPEITRVVDMAVETIRAGGRIFYVGAGTSGRLAVLDAVECPPTFSTPPDLIQAILAGGSRTWTQAQEGVEDDRVKAAADLKARKVCAKDLIIGVTRERATPYTHAALEFAKQGRGCQTACDRGGGKQPDLAKVRGCHHLHDASVPEVITGSTRMKAGTAQKMVLNMISTATMVRLGMTYSNWMINVSMTNEKLRERGTQILREILGLHEDELKQLVERSRAATSRWLS